MKFSLLSMLLLTVIVGLSLALYVEHSANEKREAKLLKMHQEELEQQKDGLAVRYGFENLLQNYTFRNDRSVRPDYGAAALGLVVSIFDNVEFLDRDNDLRIRYGETPSLRIVVALLKQLDCQNAEEYFRLYRKKMKTLGMTGMEENFGLGTAGSERRSRLTEFIQQAANEHLGDSPRARSNR